MTAFSKGQQASLTLDEQDILTITGSCKLQITSTPKPTYETLTNGDTIGPFGAVTLVILTGLGDGTFLQSPSNYAQAVSMVDMSPAQIAAPTAAQLAATNVLYQLNAPPYTIYQSNGTGMTVFGGGVSQFTSLTDATTAPLPTTNTPLATALATKQAALTSGTNIKTVNGSSILGSGDLTVSGAGATLVTFSTTIPLDGNKYSASHTLTTNETWTVGTTNEAASPSYYVEVVPNGHTPTFTGFLVRSGSWNASNVMQVNAGIQNTRPQVILFDTGIPCSPVFSAQSAPSGTSGVAYSYTFVASAATSYALASGTLPSGLSLNTSTGVLSGTPASIASYTFVISATNSNGTTNSTSQSVVINPPAPVFSAQSAPAGAVGTSYSYTFVASNTTSFAVASGALPAGLTLNTSTGVLSGTPTTSASYTFVISATGAGGTTSSTSQSVTITASSSYLRFLTLSGFTETGTGPYAYATGSSPSNALGTNLKFPAGVNSQVTLKLTTLTGTSSAVLYSVENDNTTSPNGSAQVAGVSYSGDPASQAWNAFQNSGGSNPGSGFIAANLWIQITKGGGTSPTFAFAQSSDGSSFTTFYTTSVKTDVDYFVKVQNYVFSGSTSTFSAIAETGMA